MSREPRHVLVVDDNSANRKLLCVIVTEMGWSHDSVEDGAAAVQACDSQGPFDLILMDYRMPVMDGADATMAIRARGGWASRIPIIGITADDSQTTRARCIAAGMMSCLSKPIQPLAVAALMRRALSPAPVQPEQPRLAG